MLMERDSGLRKSAGFLRHPNGVDQETWASHINQKGCVASILKFLREKSPVLVAVSEAEQTAPSAEPF